MEYELLRFHMEQFDASYQICLANGYTDPMDGLVQTASLLAGQGVEGGVCAQVRLRLEQQAVISRDAFRATLEIVNEEELRLEQLEVTLTVYDAAGKDVTDRFGVRPPELLGLTAVDGTGIVAGASTGTARWVLIPAADAAPTEQTQYFVAGRFSYRQGNSVVSVPLSPVGITVLPNPRLYVDYFHERDVFSDDPFTDLTEPSIPFNLAVMIQNKGYGVAKNFRIASAQPQIVENEKGLLIDFQIIATEVAGQNLTPSLTAQFGNINPGATAVGRWLFTSTLQGLFVDYSASFEHIDALGTRKLSLIEQVNIHEMIRLVHAPGAFDDGTPDFLVNDVPDVYDRPDTLWLSDGSAQGVTVVETAVHDGAPTESDLQIQLTATLGAGWAYLRVPEPADGQFRLVGIRRSDGTELLTANFWTTDRTFVGLGRRPTREHILHLLDHDSTGTYTLTYAPPVPVDTAPPNSAITALPAESGGQIAVSWIGDDGDGTGIAFFDIFVSANGGAFVPWLQRTTLNGAVYTGTQGHTLAFYSIATDRSGNRESAPSTPDATTSVTLVNRAPVLEPIPVQILDEGKEFQWTVIASDPDLPSDRLTFSLVSAPLGMSINASSGLIRWLTSEGTGPSTNTVAVRVEDSGSPPLSASAELRVEVREVNQAPWLAPIASVTINEGFTLLVTNVATDLDLPANTFSFTFATTPPPGATLNATNGLFRWRPSETQGPSTNLMGLVVSDNGAPSLSATQYFTVIVRDYLSDLVLGFGVTNLMVGETNAVPLTLTANLDVVDLSVRLRMSGTRLTGLTLNRASAEVVSSSIVALGSDEHLLQLTLDPALRGSGARTVATLGFTAVSNAHSAIVRLEGLELNAHVLSGQAVGKSTLLEGRVYIVGREPLLAIERRPELRVRVYGIEGRAYALEWRTNVLAGPWVEALRFTLPQRFMDLTNLPVNLGTAFFRAVEVVDEAPRLGLAPGESGVYWLTVQGPLGTGLFIESATNLGPGQVWQPWLGLTLTNPPAVVPWTNTGETRRFFRAVTP